MISQHSTAPGGRLQHGAGWWGMVAGSALLTVAVVTAIGVWQLRDQRSTSTARQEAAAPVSAAVTRPASTSAGREDAVVYFVSSPEQADRVQAEIAAARAAAEGQGMSLPETMVLVAGTPEDEARAAELLGADQYSRLMSGRSDLRVVDLRPATTSAPPLDPAALSDLEQDQRWLQAQISALGDADVPYATTPVSNCESFVDRFAC